MRAASRVTCAPSASRRAAITNRPVLAAAKGSSPQAQAAATPTTVVAKAQTWLSFFRPPTPVTRSRCSSTLDSIWCATHASPPSPHPPTNLCLHVHAQTDIRITRTGRQAVSRGSAGRACARSRGWRRCLCADRLVGGVDARGAAPERRDRARDALCLHCRCASGAFAVSLSRSLNALFRTFFGLLTSIRTILFFKFSLQFSLSYVLLILRKWENYIN